MVTDMHGISRMSLSEARGLGGGGGDSQEPEEGRGLGCAWGVPPYLHHALGVAGWARAQLLLPPG